MKKNEFIITEMYESTSKRGNRYFYGQAESGSKFIMQKVKKRLSKNGEPIWNLSIVQ